MEPRHQNVQPVRVDGDGQLSDRVVEEGAPQ